MQKVNVFWLLNNLIASNFDIKFIKSVDLNHEITICSKWDEYWEEHKDEIYQMLVDFIIVKEKVIKIFVKDGKKKI